MYYRFEKKFNKALQGKYDIFYLKLKQYYILNNEFILQQVHALYSYWLQLLTY